MPLVVRQRLLIAISALAIVAMLFVPRIPQDPAYHDFADHNVWLGIPNAFDILSNLLFIWVGVDGLYRLLRRQSLNILEQMFPAYACFFAALIMIALGSGYYHWEPNNQSLAWDRAPMTLAFMSFFSILMAERISLPVAKRLFPALLAFGLLSVVYWYFSEQAGHGDLRAYVLVQFLPVILTPLILLQFAGRFDRGSDIWWLLTWFLVSKLCEHFDHEIFEILGIVSGHSLKHVSSGIACLVFLRHLRLRKTLAA